MANSNGHMPEVQEALESEIVRSGVTITKILEQRGLKGGVELPKDGTPAPSASSLLVDQAGRKYDVGKVIATGGMEAVLRAKDVNLRRIVAMKVLRDQKKATDAHVLRFIEEAQITGQLEHPGIVPVHELGVDSHGGVFYTMKFVRCVTLEHVIAGLRDGRADIIAKYPLNSLLNIFLKCCDALAFAHTKGVVHRDIKPDNIMIGEFGEVLVLDWGVAKVLWRSTETPEAFPTSDTVEPAGNGRIESARSDTPDSAGSATLEGQIIGTPSFMAPEQACGQTSRIDARTDIYALGAILYAILALHPPVRGESVKEVLARVVNGAIEPICSNGGHHVLPHLPGGHGDTAAMLVIARLCEDDLRHEIGGAATVLKALDWFQRAWNGGSKEAAAYWPRLQQFLRQWMNCAGLETQNRETALEALRDASELLSNSSGSRPPPGKSNGACAPSNPTRNKNQEKQLK